MIPCPHCGESISERAVACKHCGSDSDTGWKDDLDYYSVELPEAELERKSATPLFKGIAIVLILLLLGTFARALFTSRVGQILLIAFATAGTLWILRIIRERTENRADPRFP